MLTAYTLEADDAAYALEEILQQLQMEKRPKKRSVGAFVLPPGFCGDRRGPGHFAEASL